VSHQAIDANIRKDESASQNCRTSSLRTPRRPMPGIDLDVHIGDHARGLGGAIERFDNPDGRQPVSGLLQASCCCPSQKPRDKELAE